MKYRTLLAAAAGVVMLVSGTTAALAEKLVISNWDGYMPKDMAEKFKAATGIDLEIAVHATNEEIMWQTRAHIPPMMFWERIVFAAASGVPVAIWRMNSGMSISVGQAVMQGASWQK